MEKRCESRQSKSSAYVFNLCALWPLSRQNLISFRFWFSCKVGANRPMLVLAALMHPGVLGKSKDHWTVRQEINALDPPWSLPL